MRLFIAWRDEVVHCTKNMYETITLVYHREKEDEAQPFLNDHFNFFWNISVLC